MMKIASPLTTEAVPTLQWMEVASSLQIPSFHIIGLAAQEVTEARERVRAAIETSGFRFPKRRLVINLSPASVRKRGTASDLAMALAILVSTLEGAELTERIAASGELSLDGNLKPVGQVMRTLYACCKEGVRRILLASSDYEKALSCLELLKEAGEITGSIPEIIGVTNLREAWDFLQRPRDRVFPKTPATKSRIPEAEDDPSGLLPLEPHLERLLCVSAAGKHHLLLLGPRGSGKSHALDWFTHLQPRPDARTQVHSLLISELINPSDSSQSPLSLIRRVGSQVRAAALIGGAQTGSVKPGEFSLAHGGCLFADELPEWSRDSREALREPLERGKITLTRAQAVSELPARFTFVANGNLCPCGGWPKHLPLSKKQSGSSSSPCICSPSHIRKYLERLSGPILDRIDLVSLLSNPPHSEKTAEKSTRKALRNRFREIRDRTEEARGLSSALWGMPPGDLSAGQLESILNENPEWNLALQRLKLSSLRSRHKVARVAMSFGIWDYLHSQSPAPHPKEFHFDEASFYRPERLDLFPTAESFAFPSL